MKRQLVFLALLATSSLPSSVFAAWAYHVDDSAGSQQVTGGSTLWEWLFTPSTDITVDRFVINLARVGYGTETFCVADSSTIGSGSCIFDSQAALYSSEAVTGSNTA